MRTIFALGICVSIVAGHFVINDDKYHSFYTMLFNSMHISDVAVIFDNTTVEDAKEVLKLASDMGMQFLAIHALETSDKIQHESFPQQFIVLCNYSSMNYTIRHFSKIGLMTYPYVWVFVTDDDLSPMFSTDTIALVLSISNTTGRLHSYAKGCLGLNVTRTISEELKSIRRLNVAIISVRPLLGCTMRVVKLSPHSGMSIPPKHYSQSDLEILMLLAESMGFQLSFEDIPYPGDVETLFQAMKRNEFDIALPFLVATNRRTELATLKTHVYTIPSLGIIKNIPILNDATSVFKPLAGQTWMLAIVTVIVITICYAFTLILHDARGCSLQSLQETFTIYAAFVQQESHSKGDDRASGRIFLLIASATSLVLLTAYSSVLFAVLSSTKPRIPFRSLAEMNANPNYKPLLHAGSAEKEIIENSKWHESLVLNQKLLICGSKCIEKSSTQALARLSVDATPVYFMDLMNFNVMNKQCQYVIAIDDVIKLHFYIIFRKAFFHSPYTSFKLLQMKERGIIKRVYSDLTLSKKCSSPKTRMDMEMLYLPFVANIIGMIVSILVLAIEVYVLGS